MDPQDAIGVEMHIELAAVGPQLGGSPECGEGVLGTLAGGTAVGDDFRAGHRSSLTFARLRRLTSRECQ